MQAALLALLVLVLMTAKVKFTYWQRTQIRRTLLKDLLQLLKSEKLECENENSSFGLSNTAASVSCFLPEEPQDEEEFVFLDRRRGIPAVIRRIGSEITTVRLDAKEIDLEIHPHRWDALALLSFVTEGQEVLSQ